MRLGENERSSDEVVPMERMMESWTTTLLSTTWTNDSCVIREHGTPLGMLEKERKDTKMVLVVQAWVTR